MKENHTFRCVAFLCTSISLRAGIQIDMYLNIVRSPALARIRRTIAIQQHPAMLSAGAGTRARAIFLECRARAGFLVGIDQTELRTSAVRKEGKIVM